jgi:hypothetical protein
LCPLLLGTLPRRTRGLRRPSTWLQMIRHRSPYDDPHNDNPPKTVGRGGRRHHGCAPSSWGCYPARLEDDDGRRLCGERHGSCRGIGPPPRRQRRGRDGDWGGRRRRRRQCWGQRRGIGVGCAPSSWGHYPAGREDYDGHQLGGERHGSRRGISPPRRRRRGSRPSSLMVGRLNPTQQSKICRSNDGGR